MSTNKYYGSPIPPPMYQRAPPYNQRVINQPIPPNTLPPGRVIPATYPPKGGMVLPPSPSMLNEQFVTPQGVQVTYDPTTGKYKAYEQKTFLNAPRSAHEIAIGTHVGPPTAPQYLPNNIRPQPYGPPPPNSAFNPQQRPMPPPPNMQYQQQQQMMRPPQNQGYPPQMSQQYPPQQRIQQQQPHQPSYLQSFQNQKFVADTNQCRGPPPPPNLNAIYPPEMVNMKVPVPGATTMIAPNQQLSNKPPSIPIDESCQPTAVTDQLPFQLPPLKSSTNLPPTNDTPKLEEIPSSSADAKVPPPTPTV